MRWCKSNLNINGVVGKVYDVSMTLKAIYSF